MNYSQKQKDLLSTNEISDLKLDIMPINKGVNIETIDQIIKSDDNKQDITNEDLDLMINEIHTITNEDLDNSYDLNEGIDNND